MDQVNHVVETGKAHSQGAYNQLLEEENLPVRVGVIAGTGSLGLLLGLRGRLVKRVVYTGLGAGLGAAVCYPDQARETLDTVETESKNLANAAYSMVTGGGGEGEVTVSSPPAPATVSSVVFVDPALQKTVEVEGDPGMGTEEDKDLYTTRGN